MRRLTGFYEAMLAVLVLSVCQARAVGLQGLATALLTGRVASADGTPLNGVTVSEGVRNTQTDMEGMYALGSDSGIGGIVGASPWRTLTVGSA